MKMNWEIVLWTWFGLVLVISVVLGVYQEIEMRRIDAAHRDITDWWARQDAIYAAWERKHKIMPYTGPDVGWFVGIYGLCLPSFLYVVAVYILNSFFHFL